MNAVAAGTIRRPVIRAAALLLALGPGLAGCGADTTTEPQPHPQPTATPAPTFETESHEPVEAGAGTYRMPASAWSVVDLTVTLPRGWTVQYGHVLAKHPDQDRELGFYPVVVEEIYTDACGGEGVTRKVGPGVDDLVDALLEQRGPLAGDPVETTLGGHPATRVDLEVPPNLDLDDCRLADIGLQVWYAAPADKYFVLLRDGIASVYVLDVDGMRQVFLVQHRSGTSDKGVAELHRVLDSIRLDP